MARRKTLDKYPQEYHSLFQMGGRRKVVVACDSNKAAQNLRNDLYSFRAVLYQHGSASEIQFAQNVRLIIEDRNLIAEPIREIKDGLE